MVQNGMSIRKTVKATLASWKALRRWVTNPPNKQGRGTQSVLTTQAGGIDYCHIGIISIVTVEQCSAVSWLCGRGEIADIL